MIHTVEKKTFSKALSGLSEQEMKAFSIALYAFNVLDYLFTARLIYGLGFGTSVEANRLIAAGFDASPAAVMIYKVVVIGLMVFFLYKKNDNRIARVGIVGLLAVYSLLLLYHLCIIWQLQAVGTMGLVIVKFIPLIL